MIVVAYSASQFVQECLFAPAIYVCVVLCGVVWTDRSMHVASCVGVDVGCDRAKRYSRVTRTGVHVSSQTCRQSGVSA